MKIKIKKRDRKMEREGGGEIRREGGERGVKWRQRQKQKR